MSISVTNKKMSGEDSSLKLRVITFNESYFNPSQKCIIPSESFPANGYPGCMAKCFLQPYGEVYLCRIFPMLNKKPKNFCRIDKSVLLASSKTYDNIVTDEYLTKVVVVEDLLEEFSQLKAEVTLCPSSNVDAQITDRDSLETVVKELLSIYCISSHCHIMLGNLGVAFGIKEISIISAEPDTGTLIGRPATEFTVTDVKYCGSSHIIWTEIAGMDKTFAELERLKAEIALRSGACRWEVKPSCNTIVIGPSGSGKTSICYNFILKNWCNFFEIKSADIIRPYPGETEEALRASFKTARDFVENFMPTRMTVVLIEDIDIICPAETTEKTDSSRTARISVQLAAILDELSADMVDIIVLATTSNIEAVATSIRRHGRFDNEVYINSPNELQRQQILHVLFEQIGLKNNESKIADLMSSFAKQTQGYVGADLCLLVKNTSRFIAKENLCRCHVDADDIEKYFPEALKMTKPTSLRGSDVTVSKTDESFKSIGGMHRLKQILEISVLTPLKQPEAFKRFGIDPLKGILLYGPPGCAKTSIAKCLATEANMTFISTSGAEIYSPYIGNAEKFVCKIFNTARQNAPCLIFLDEIDAIVGSREKGTKNDVQTRVLSTLLTEMDGIGIKVQTHWSVDSCNILVVAATNRPDMIDNALMRPGRFDKLIHVPAPDYNSRLDILNMYKSKMPFNKEIPFDEIAKQTNGFSGADLCNLCNETAMHAFTSNLDVKTIEFKDFESVLSKTKASLTETQINFYYEFEKKHSL